MFKKETVQKIANLAHIEIQNFSRDKSSKFGKGEKIRKDLSEVLDYIEKIQEVDTSDVDVLDGSVLNITRKDVVKEIPEVEKEKMLSSAKKKNGYFQVESI